MGGAARALSSGLRGLTNDVRKRPSLDELNAEQKKRRETTEAASPAKAAPGATGVPGSFVGDGRTAQRSNEVV